VHAKLLPVTSQLPPCWQGEEEHGVFCIEGSLDGDDIWLFLHAFLDVVGHVAVVILMDATEAHEGTCT